MSRTFLNLIFLIGIIGVSCTPGKPSIEGDPNADGKYTRKQLSSDPEEASSFSSSDDSSDDEDMFSQYRRHFQLDEDHLRVDEDYSEEEFDEGESLITTGKITVPIRIKSKKTQKPKVE